MAVLRVVSEHYFHKPVDVRGYIEDAQDICRELELSDDAEAALLPTLVQLLSAKHTQFEQVSPLGILGG